MAKKILNIEIEPVITSECWTYYKFAVMQTANYFDKWLVGRMRIYMQDDGTTVFGEWPKYSLSYFSEILELHEMNIFLVSEKNIVQFLIDQINKNTYIIIDMNENELYDLEQLEFRNHETLIYGYDTENQVFFAPLLINGKFSESRISFGVIEKAYKDIIDHYRKKRDQIYVRRQWIAPITLMKLRDFYENMNVFYDFIFKLKWEWDGTIQHVTRVIREPQESLCIYKGLPMLQHLATLLRKNPRHMLEEAKSKLAKACLHLYEHQNILHRSMHWFLKELKSTNGRLYDLVEKYGGCCERLKINVYLFQKYLLTEDDCILDRIADSLDELFYTEKDLLNEFVELAQDEYIKMYEEQRER